MNAETSTSSTAAIEQRARAFAALGDPVRLAIVEMLRDQDVAPHALSDALEVPSNLLAHHLRVLESAQLVKRTKSQGDGRRAYVSLNFAAMDELILSAASISARRVVFVCTRNSARSILAESIWSAVSDVPATSAGTHPVAAINPRTRSAADRAHLTLVRDTPQLLQDVLRQEDLVISVCDGVNEELTDLANVHMHWSVPDPVLENTDEAFTAAITNLRDRIHALAPRVHRPNKRKASA